METHLQDDANLRDYLLGRLGDDSELVEQIDERSLSDSQFSETLDVIEDELIEEYLEGTLSAADTQAVEIHFLRPPERRRQLRNARLLSHYFSSAVGNAQSAPLPNVRRFPDLSAAFRWFTPLRTFAEVAAAVLLVVSTLYGVNQHLEFQAEVRQARQQLDQERQRVAALNDQLGSALKLAHPPMAMLSLLQPGIRRGDAHLPELVVGADTRSIHVEIALPSGTPGLYSVELQETGNKLWSRDKLEAFTAPGGALLIFDLPAQVLPHGESEIVVRHGSGAETSYWFLVSQL